MGPELYNHIDPAAVGNDMRILVTEMAGRAVIELKGRELGVDLAGRARRGRRGCGQVKDLEADGWSFEAADASLELLLRNELSGEPDAAVRRWSPTGSSSTTAATARSCPRRRSRCTSAAGAGDRHRRGQRPGQRPGQRAAPGAAAAPVLDSDGVELADYKVRILGWNAGTDAVTRVLVESTDGEREWTTVGVHDNIVEASWLALCDALAHKAMRVRQLA